MIRKRFGQNFLTDKHALRRIADALALEGHETVIEIGPGKGALTDELVGRCARLVGIELDRDLVAYLTARYKDRASVEIISSDVLDVDLASVARGPYVLAGNVPYYLTTPIIFHALRSPRPVRSVYLVQREVAERLAAGAGSEAYGALSVNVQLVADVEFIGPVGAGAFFPRPAVESAIVRLTPKPSPLVTPADEDALRTFVTGMFGQRRRQLPRAVRTVSSLGAEDASAAVEQAGLDPLLRAEDVPPASFAALWAAVRPRVPNDPGSTARS